MEDEGDHETEAERAERDEDPGAQLVEVLDQRGLLAVAKAPRQPLHATALGDGVALARGRVHRGGGRDRKLGGLVVVLAGEGVLELPHALAHRAADLRKALRAEEE